MESKELMHLLRRTTYGPSKAQLEKYSGLSRKNVINDIFANSRGSIQYLDVIQPEMQKFIDYAIENKGKVNDYIDLDKDELRKLALAHFYDLRAAWIEEMFVTEQQFNEKMALFWHNHFATSEKRDIVGQQMLLHEIRTKALGSFGELLKAVSKSSVMISYLNTQQNTKKSPNENFARELCELFTLGRDNGYSEGDIKEIARCFTSWKSIKGTGNFIEVKKGADEGQKLIFGQKGNFSGDDVLDMILKKKETAYFLVTKIYKYFVNPVVDVNLVQQLADKFYSSGYDISSLMKSIFSSDWFYEKKNIGSLIKSPLELVLNIHCQAGLNSFQKNKSLFALRALQQTIFDLPNVSGWPHDRQWIDSSSLLFRLQLPSIIILNEALQVSVKENNDDTGGEMTNDKTTQKEKRRKLLKQRLNKELLGTEGDLSFSIPNNLNETNGLLQEYFLAVSPRIEMDKIAGKDFNAQKRAVVEIMSTPEYQLT